MRRPSKDQAPEMGAVGAIPPDAVIAQSDRSSLDAARQTAVALLAVGVPLGEALNSLARSMVVTDLITLSGELAPNGVERMRALYEAQLEVEDKKAFGQACLAAGFNPVGVALGLFGSMEDALVQRKVYESLAKVAVKAFGVDTWMANLIHHNGLDMRDTAIRRVSGQVLVVPTNLRFVFGSTCPRGTSVAPWLAEVGGDLDVRFVDSLRFPKLRSVGGTLYARGCKKITFSVLETIGGRLDKGGSLSVNVPKLTSVNGKPFVQKGKT